MIEENCKRLVNTGILNNANRNKKKCKIRKLILTAQSKTTYKRIYSMDSLIKAKKNEKEIQEDKVFCHPCLRAYVYRLKLHMK